MNLRVHIHNFIDFWFCKYIFADEFNLVFIGLYFYQINTFQIENYTFIIFRSLNQMNEYTINLITILTI